jgi:hypothetical protein
MGEPNNVLGDWQHVPRVVTVVGPGGEHWADVRTHQHWSILEEEHREIVQWEVIVMLPAHIAPYPLVFEDRGEARRWARSTDAVRDIDWTSLDGPESAPREEATHHSLTLHSEYNGGGLHYKVNAGRGIDDWTGKDPRGANVPDWMPRSFDTSGRNDRSDLYGHEYLKPRRHQHICVVGLQRCNLPFPVLDAASAKY